MNTDYGVWVWGAMEGKLITTRVWFLNKVCQESVRVPIERQDRRQRTMGQRTIKQRLLVRLVRVIQHRSLVRVMHEQHRVLHVQKDNEHKSRVRVKRTRRSCFPRLSKGHNVLSKRIPFSLRSLQENDCSSLHDSILQSRHKPLEQMSPEDRNRRRSSR